MPIRHATKNVAGIAMLKNSTATISTNASAIPATTASVIRNAYFMGYLGLTG